MFYEAYPEVQQGSPEAVEIGISVLANQFVNGLLHELKQKLAGREGEFQELLSKARFEEARLCDVVEPSQKNQTIKNMDPPGSTPLWYRSREDSVGCHGYNRDFKTSKFTPASGDSSRFTSGGIGNNPMDSTETRQRYPVLSMQTIWTQAMAMQTLPSKGPRRG